jgi:hypothetical protein
MFRLTAALRYFFSLLLAVGVAGAAAQVSFSETINRQPPVFIPVIDAVTHTAASALLFENLQLKSNSGTKRLLIFSDQSQTNLAENISALLRSKVNDPRLSTHWKWSQNWQRLSNTAEGSCLIFKRPGKLTAPEKNSSAHDYYEGWVSCSSTPGTMLRLICKATADDCVILKSSKQIITEHTAEPGKWIAFEWPAGEPVQLTFRSSTSPEIGVLAAEPENGFSIWQLPAPACADYAMREQATMLNPYMIVVFAQLHNAETICTTISKLFPEHPLLLCCETEANNVAHKQFMQLSTRDAALLLYYHSNKQHNRAAIITRQIEQLAGI